MNVSETNVRFKKIKVGITIADHDKHFKQKNKKKKIR